MMKLKNLNPFSFLYHKLKKTYDELEKHEADRLPENFEKRMEPQFPQRWIECLIEQSPLEF